MSHTFTQITCVSHYKMFHTHTHTTTLESTQHNQSTNVSHTQKHAPHKRCFTHSNSHPQMNVTFCQILLHPIFVWVSTRVQIWTTIFPKQLVCKGPIYVFYGQWEHRAGPNWWLGRFWTTLFIKPMVFQWFLTFFTVRPQWKSNFCVQSAQNNIKPMVFAWSPVVLSKHRGPPSCGFKTSWPPFITYSNPFPVPSQSVVV